jgi:hypothetical protein
MSRTSWLPADLHHFTDKKNTDKQVRWHFHLPADLVFLGAFLGRFSQDFQIFSLKKKLHQKNRPYYIPYFLLFSFSLWRVNIKKSIHMIPFLVLYGLFSQVARAKV